MLTSLHLHMKSGEVCIKTRSPPAPLPIQGQVTEHTTVKWPITVDSRRKSVSRKVEQVSQNVDMDSLPVCFGNFKKCYVNFHFISLELVSL